MLIIHCVIVPVPLSRSSFSGALICLLCLREY
jgi:hypothetical protein